MGQLSFNELRFLLNEMADWRVIVPLDSAPSHSLRPNPIEAGGFRLLWDLRQEETLERLE